MHFKKIFSTSSNFILTFHNLSVDELAHIISNKTIALSYKKAFFPNGKLEYVFTGTLEDDNTFLLYLLNETIFDFLNPKIHIKLIDREGISTLKATICDNWIVRYTFFPFMFLLLAFCIVLLFAKSALFWTFLSPLTILWLFVKISNLVTAYRVKRVLIKMIQDNTRDGPVVPNGSLDS